MWTTPNHMSEATNVVLGGADTYLADLGDYNWHRIIGVQHVYRTEGNG